MSFPIRLVLYDIFFFCYNINPSRERTSSTAARWNRFFPFVLCKFCVAKEKRGGGMQGDVCFSLEKKSKYSKEAMKKKKKKRNF